MGIEDNINATIFSKNSEKTFIDKLMSKEDSDRIKTLIQKKDLTREELLEILYLISGTEAKLVNYTQWERYVILKFFIWIREYIKIVEYLFDYKDDLLEKEKAGEIVLTERTNKLIKNINRMMEHNSKFLIDLYFNIARTTLSINATGFIEILKNKFEINYPSGAPASVQQLPQQQPKKWWSF